MFVEKGRREKGKGEKTRIQMENKENHEF